jgi:glycosyltransferase involved in cell wall biosynthesis
MGLLLQRYEAIYGVNAAVLDTTVRCSSEYVGDIVFFPAIDWGFRFQRPQHLARQLGARGYRVFYFSTVPLLIPNRPDYVVQGNPEPGVVLVQLSSGSFRTPDFYKDELTADELAGFLKSFDALRQDFDIVLPAILIQQPFWWPLVSKLAGRSVVYDCLDHHAGFHALPNPVLQGYEQQLAEKADAVVVTSAALADSFQRVHGCHLIRNGCEFDRFGRAIRVKSQSKPIVGYVGAVSDWFDGQLVFEIARERSDWQFDIYGATVGADIAAARALPNVNFFGEIPYESVPSAMAHFDVCIIPFKLNSLTLATNPVKVYEYLAVGRPVVATELPELLGMEAVDVFCASSANKFIDQIKRAIVLSDQPNRVKVRQDWACQNNWAKRADELIPLIAVS